MGANRTSLITTATLAVVLAGCGAGHKQDAPATNAGSCMKADVLSNDDVLTVANTGKLPWSDLGATFQEGGEGDNSFKYTIPNNNVVQPGTTITIPLKQFVRDDGLRYDPIK